MASARVYPFIKSLPQNKQFWLINYVTGNQRQLFTRPFTFLQSISSIATTKPINFGSYTTYTAASPSPQSLKALHAIKNVILPDLMDVSVSQIVDRRNIFRVIYCWLATRLILPKVFKTFRMKDFQAEIFKTMEAVSHGLSKQEYAKLHGLVHHDTLRELKQHIDNMTEEQRHQIALRGVDVFKVLPYWARYVTQYEKGPDAQHIELTIIMHVGHPLTKNPKKLSELVDG